MESAEDEIRVNRSLLDKTAHPHGYLLSAIEEKEKDVIKYKQLLRKSEKDYDLLKNENDNL